MKRITIALVAAALLCVSCEKIELFSRAFGDEVTFGSTSRRGSCTKAAYSGALNSENYERIDWVVGDKVGIYCAQASEPVSHYHEYFIKDGSVTSGTVSSSAKLDHDPNSIGLRWGTANPHVFTALCPAPGNGETGIAVAENLATCVLPAVQTNSGIAGTTDYTAGVNARYLYLVGYGTAAPGGEDTPVYLYFDPAVTTFEFTLKNDFDDSSDMTVASAGITTSASGAKLVGTYTVSPTNINATTGTLLKTDIGTSGLTGATASMEFSPSLTIKKGKYLKFTLFTHPGYDITKLTFWFSDGSTTKSFNFKYSDSSRGTDGWVDFTAFHKFRITGLMAKNSAGWTINAIPVVADWGGNGKDLDMEDSGNVISFTTVAVTGWSPEDKGGVNYTD